MPGKFDPRGSWPLHPSSQHGHPEELPIPMRSPRGSQPTLLKTRNRHYSALISEQDKTRWRSRQAQGADKPWRTFSRLDEVVSRDG